MAFDLTWAYATPRSLDQLASTISAGFRINKLKSPGSWDIISRSEIKRLRNIRFFIHKRRHSIRTCIPFAGHVGTIYW